MSSKASTEPTVKYNGPNFVNFQTALGAKLAKENLKDHHLSTPTMPPSPLQNPAEYGLTDPNYGLEPRSGMAQHIEAVQLLSAPPEVDGGILVDVTDDIHQQAHQVMDENTFSILGPDTKSGIISRLSTTNEPRIVSDEFAKYAKAVKEHLANTAKAYGIILEMLDNKVATRIGADKLATAAQVFAAVKVHFEAWLRENADIEIERFRNIQIEARETVQEFADRIREIGDLVQHLGRGHGGEDDRIRLLLRGLESDYEVLVRMLRQATDTTFDSAVLALRREETLRKDKPTPSGSKKTAEKAEKVTERFDNELTALATALAAKLGPFGGRPGNRDNIVCYNCGKTGHIKRNCPSPRSGDDGNGGGSGGGQGAPSGAPPKGILKTTKFTGKQTGGGNGKGGAVKGRVFMAKVVPVTPSEPVGGGPTAREPIVTSVDESGTAATVVVPKRNNLHVWHFDSACIGGHMTGNRDFFLTYEECEGGIVVGSGEILQTAGKGTICLWAANHSGEFELVTLDGVFHVPDFHPDLNLISIDSVTQRNLGVWMDSKKVLIVNPDDENDFFCATKTGEGFTMVAAPYSAGQPPKGKALATRTLNSAQEQFRQWHRRLGHLSKSGMIKLAGNEMVKGVNMAGWKDQDLDFCEPCVRAKLTQDPFRSRDPSERATQLLERVHTDSSGKMPVRSHTNKLYFSVARDEATGFVGVVFTNDKEQISSKVKQGVVLAWENELEKRIKEIHCDGGTEFNGLETFQLARGGKFSRSPANQQELNGLAEATIKTVKNTALSMLFDAGLPDKFWPSAVSHAVHLMNRSPYRPLKDKTPFEAFTGKKPDVSNLAVFGCPAYGLIPVRSVDRPSFGDKTVKGIFLGISEQTGAYMIGDRKTGKIQSFRTARFDDRAGDTSSPIRPTSSPIATTAPRRASAAGSDSSSSDSGNVSDYFSTDDMPELESIASSDADSDSDSEDGPRRPLPRQGGARRGRGCQGGTPNRPPEFPDDEDEDDGHGQGGRTGTGPRRTSRRGAGTRTLTAGSSMLDEWKEQRRRSEAIHGKGLVARTGELDPETGTDLDLDAGDVNDEPTYSTCKSGGDWDSWKPAVRDELRGVIESGTIEPADPADMGPRRKPISSKWAMKVKRDSSGNESKKKARLVARGFTQREGIDYQDVFAPVTRYSTVRYLVSLLSNPSLAAVHTDVKLAYLNGDLREELYMWPPEDFEEFLDSIADQPDLSTGTRERVERLQEGLEKAKQSGRPFALQLCKPLYGLKQAGNEWNRKLDGVLGNLGFANSPADPCLYFRDVKGSWIILAVYVDDMFWISNNTGLVNDVIEAFSRKFTVSNLGVPEWFLGMRIRRGDGYSSVDQVTYARKVLQQFNMMDCNPLTTPLDPSINFTRDMGPQTAAERAEMARIPYREAIGSLMYLANGTRPDIAAAVGILARFMSDPGHQHWLGVKRVLRYLKGTLNLGLIYRSDAPGAIVGYSDADWGSELDSRKSTSGYVFTRLGAAISWQSKKQPTVSLSSTESELHALVSAMKEALAWRNRTKAVDLGQEGPTRIYCDNNGALALVRAPTSKDTTKHIAIKSFFARDTVENGLVETAYVKSLDNTADVLTKAISGFRMVAARLALGLGEVAEA